MAEIEPFRGLLYRVPEAELARVLAPPYDVISPAYQEELYGRDSRNIVRVILNRNGNYDEAGETFRRWQAEGVLAPDPEPVLYLLDQAFTVEGRAYRRYGLMARFRAEDPSRGVILPHEQTRTAPKEDRYRLLRATGANFSPIFLMFPDPAGGFATLAVTVMGTPPDLAYTDDGGVGHRLWRVADPALWSAFRELLAGGKAYIADGHHRYATALRHRDEAGPDGAWTLGYFTPLDAPGLVVLPYHRLLSEGPSLPVARAALDPHFRLTDVPDVQRAAAATAASRMPYAFALAEPGRGALVAESRPGAEGLLPAGSPPSLRALDTSFLQLVVLERLLAVPAEAVSYMHSLEEVERALAESRCRLAVLLRPTPVGQILAVAEAGESMPPKSTFFHPKLPSGLVIHPLVA